ncbi:filamentous hemagglutinin [Selenomonas sp. oral taxon 920]|uniref:hemagglutinin repeat-containing protein n=1 Tax=Selenomonas sp. oral taxon 920 TaxID=1884263 RepID=UPI000840C4DE|nr:hemagglutinin repeat-containing protein [Selenomonas sp. oral taxon 920]AOH48031.1 filamentous hemagglutinin [Selenomonas sp. oral taxon 920]
MRKKDLVRKITCWMTLGIFSLQPALTFAADIVADASAPEAQRPYVTETANGIPLVQIARPDGSDVSVNRYDAFSVPERGAILNNAFLFSNTQLAGYIEGNPNLSGGPARIIVNEVMSDRPSELRGFLEVAGTKADVVIANPNGIYADGAGFLNTSRAILASGRTERDAAGGYAGLRIEDGRAYITGKGLDARGADSAEIYARAVEVNAGLWANHAKIVTGQNSIAKDGSISPIPSETTSTAPQYAIDLAEIGGMYANRITMIGTEKGLGVNLTGQLSATHAVSLDVSGNLKTTGSLYSDGDVAVRADEIVNTNLIYGGKNTSIRAKELTNKSGGRIYGDTVTINAERVTNETDAALEARLAREAQILSQYAPRIEAAHRNLTPPSSGGIFGRRADLSKQLNSYQERIREAEAAYDAQQHVVDALRAELDAKPSGVIAAHRQLDVSANTIQNTGNALLYSGGDIALTAGETLKNSGARIEAQGSIVITAPHIENENVAFAAKRSITNVTMNPTKIRIDEPGHMERGKAFPEWEFRDIDSGYGAYHSHIAQKPIYEHAAYEEIKPLSPAEIAAGEEQIPAELIGTYAPNYDYDDPIFKELGVASMSTPRPPHGDPARAAWDAQYRIVLDTLNTKIDAYNREAEEYNRTTAQAAGQKINLLTFIESAHIHSTENVTSSLPAAIRAGNSITLHGDTENTDSTISAGETLHIDGALTENAHQQQEQTVTLGTTQGSYTERRSWIHKGKVRKFHSKVYMTPEVVRTNPTPIGVHVIEENAAAESISEKQRQRIAETLSPFGLVSVPQTAGTGTGGTEHLSLSALYRVHPESTATYLVETDPAFTNRKKFLSSDYMYRLLKWDPDKIPKRIGDGFYEQQLLADQILRQTGKRHLEGYTDDETAFRALMDAGITYAKEMNLSPGIALSKEQVAALTSDMIWLEEREVYVNGKKERAVYPVLYTKNTNGLRLTAGGSLISAKNIAIETKDALKNAGTLYGENILAHAGDIENTGLIRGLKIGLKSERDIRVQGSVIGDKAVVLEAKNNIDVSSTTERLAHQDVLNTTAGIAVKGDEGVLVVSAGKNAALAGATLAALGKNGSVLLSAGENISLDTKKLQSEKDMTADAANYLRTKRGTELGTEIRADGNISIAAGNDLTARAADIASKNGTTSLSAGNDISLTAGREISEDHYGIRYKESGLLSTKTTTIRIDTESDIARTTNITGQNVNIAAKRDATFTAANIASDSDVNIAAGRNFSAVSAENYSHTENYKEVKKSGIFGSGGGLGFTIGTQQTKTTRDSDAITQQGTNIAALGGNVSISAGEKAHISSSNILADKDATITAKETSIDGKYNIYRESITQESKTTGLTVSFSHGLLDLGQSLYAPISRIGEVQDDRLKAAYAYQTGRMIHDAFKKNPLTNATFSLNVSFGTSKSYSRMENTTHEYAGSRIASGGNTNVTAGERDLTVTGSAITGRDVSLTAKGNVRLEAGENTNITSTENKFSSASVGASFTPQGLSNISVNASKGNGNSKETLTAYSPTLVVAENNLSLTSGKDMDILGSRAQGDKITAKVGGNLNIETLQEKETYEEQNSSMGFGISWGVKKKDKATSTKSTGQTQNPPPTNATKSTPKPNGTQVTSPTGRKFFAPTIGASWNKGNIDSHYRSAREQAGFYAGSGGFDIYVEKNTDLKGGVIASNATPDKNHLSTGTLSFSDLKNEADYSAKSIGASYHKYGNYDDMTKDEQDKVYNTKGLAPVLPMPVVGSADSTTKSAVAPATIDIRENPTQDISALSRDTANSLNKLGRIFDKAKIEEQQELAAVFGEEAFRLAHNLKDDGSGRKIAIHFAIGGIMSAITGAGFASGAIGAGLNEALIKNLKGLDPGTAQIVSAIVGAAAAKAVGGTAGAGASAAASGTKWNYFLIEHPESFAFDKLAQKTLKRKDGKELSEDEVLKLLQGVSDIFAEHEPVLSDAWNGQSENIKNYKYVVQYLMNQGITGESANDFLMSYNTYLREQIDWNVTQDAIGYFDASGNYVFKRSYNQWIQAYRPQKFWGIDLKTEDGFTRTKIIDDKNPNHTEERIHWGGWQHNPRIAENPKEEREGERADEGNTAATIRKSDVNKKDSKGSVLQDGQPSDKLESHSHTSPLEEQKGTNENHEFKGNFDPVKETVQNALTNKEGILYGGIVDSDKTGMLSKNARIGLKIFGSAGGISGTILSGMDFVKDYHEYSGRDLVKVWGTDAFALAIGFGGSAIGGTLLGLPGAYVGGVLGGVGGAYVKSWLREGIKKDKEKAAAAYKDSERR